MTEPQPHHPTPPGSGSAASRDLRNRLLAQGFSPEEADQALRDVGAPPPRTPAGHGTGSVSYALGFLGYLPLPVISNVIAGIAMAAAYPSQRRRSALAAENARRAANWGLTVVTVTVLIVGLVVVLLALFSSDDAERDVWVLWPFLGIPALGLAHLVVLIVGLVHTSQGKVFRNPLAIPFLRADRSA